MAGSTTSSFHLGSCWAQIRNRQHDHEKTAECYVQELLGMPERIKVECILGIGHPAEEKQMIPADKLQYEKIKYNHWT